MRFGIDLAAAAQATTRLRLGTAVTPLARRRPQVLANTVARLDVLSQGRVVQGVGLGGRPADEYPQAPPVAEADGL